MQLRIKRSQENRVQLLFEGRSVTIYYANSFPYATSDDQLEGGA
jgi:hypothetical protein